LFVRHQSPVISERIALGRFSFGHAALTATVWSFRLNRRNPSARRSANYIRPALNLCSDVTKYVYSRPFRHRWQLSVSSKMPVRMGTSVSCPVSSSNIGYLGH